MGYRYVPVLKWKRGEQSALSDIPDHLRDLMVPLLELVSAPLNQKTHVPNKTLDQQVAAQLGAIKNVWGTKRSVFLDCSAIADQQGTSGASGASMTFVGAKVSGLQFIPVVGLQRSTAELSAALQDKSHGICLRLTLDDFAGDLKILVNQFMATNHLTAFETDIVLDLGDQGPTHPKVVQMTTTSFMGSLPNLAAWRSLTMIATAFPPHMGEVEPNSVGQVNRTEWAAWQSLVSSGKPSRTLDFGDYAIQHPVLVDWKPFMPVSATIRYTTPDGWLLVKGISMKGSEAEGHGLKQFRTLAKRLITLPDYCGKTHCEGCRLINGVAKNAEDVGNLEKWRRIGTCHHLTMALRQLQSLNATLAASAQHP